MATVKKKPTKTTQTKLTAKQFLDELMKLKASQAALNARYVTDTGSDTKIMGIRMGELFALAKKFTPLPLDQINKLLDSKFYEVRVGAVCIMDFQARDKKITEKQRKELYTLYISKHKQINNWDMVDRSAPYVVGGYLFDKSRAPLYKLAKSKNSCERRTAIVATYYFIRQNDIDETFKIAEVLVHDKDELVNKAVGSWVREAGKRNKGKLFDFLDAYAATMPRITLRYALEKLDKKQKDFYMNKGKL